MSMQPSVVDDCEVPVAEAQLPLTHEVFSTLEWIELRASRVYRGEGVARGHGEPVIVIPGFLGSYRGLHELRDWLTRSGYAVSDPGFERNIACPDILLARVEQRVAEVHALSGQRVRLIGHSLGGSLARAAAARMPDHIEQVITLASPLHEMRAHPVVIELARLLSALTPARHGPHAEHVHGATCTCELAEALARPPAARVRRTAIYTRQDGVVDWRSCVEGNAAVDVEVPGTHVGLVVNARAYEVIAGALASRR